MQSPLVIEKEEKKRKAPGAIVKHVKPRYIYMNIKEH
jgi:hypothetical protein